jgi:hypothetical protein
VITNCLQCLVITTGTSTKDDSFIVDSLESTSAEPTSQYAKPRVRPRGYGQPPSPFYITNVRGEPRVKPGVCVLRCGPSLQLPSDHYKRFCYVVLNSHMFNATEVQLWKWCFQIKKPKHVWRSRTPDGVRCAQFHSVITTTMDQKVGTVVKTVEPRWVVYHVAEPYKPLSYDEEFRHWIV